jgi:putative ABC transport system permease protein
MIISNELIKYSLTNLNHRKARSFLTILSIFIGIAVIFIFVSFGMGLYNYVNQFYSSTSADKVSIMAKGFGAPGLDDSFAITDNDFDAIKRTPGVLEASGIYNKVVEVEKDNQKKYTFLISYDPEKPIIFELMNVKVEKGRMLTSTDNSKVVLGYNYLLKDKIFAKPYDLNDKITIQGKEYRVVGFMASIGNPQDDSQIYTTNEEMRDLFNVSKGYTWVIAKVEVDRIKSVISEIERNLRNSRDLKPGKEDFFVQSFEDMIRTYSSVLNGISAFVFLIALVSVIVSAINTSNTMITSVLERTREIGVMKSIGAKNSEILKIFLFESGFLGFSAGVLGVIVGFLITSLIKAILISAGWGFLSPSYSPYVFLGCIIFATLTGALSGIGPAIRASRVNPVQALRYE